MTVTTDDLLALLDEFHITDKALIRSSRRARADAGDVRAAAELRSAMRRYFIGVERESADHISRVDGKLEELYQRQYNLHAERTVAQRRLDGARKVLSVIGDAEAAVRQ